MDSQSQFSQSLEPKSMLKSASTPGLGRSSKSKKKKKHMSANKNQMFNQLLDNSFSNMNEPLRKAMFDD
jgi:hypothetical protein